MCDTEELVLDNGLLRAVILPREGGCVQSLVSHRSGLEFLMQARHPRTQRTPAMDAAFQHGSCAGMEECLPSVAPCGPKTDGGSVPDHGDFWQLAWQVEENTTTTRTAIHAQGFSRPLFFQRDFELRGYSLMIRYRLRNTGDEAVSFLYAAHPLLAVQQGDHVLLPQDVAWLRLGFSRHGRLGAAGDTVAWPVHQDMDLSVVQSETARTAEMLRSGKMIEGWCGVYRAEQSEGLAVRFNPAELPYLGLWLCYGGWPEDGPAPYQYAVAPEPACSPHGSLAEAQEAHAAPALLPGEERNWMICLETTPEPVTLQTFHKFCTKYTLCR